MMILADALRPWYKMTDVSSVQKVTRQVSVIRIRYTRSGPTGNVVCRCDYGLVVRRVNKILIG